MKFTPENEKLIITSIKAGNSDAYKSLYLYAYEPLCLYILNFTKDKIIAEDIVQDVFIKLWINRSKLKSEYSLIPYLYKMAYNKFVDSYRKNKKKTEELEAFKLSSLSELIEYDEDLYQQKLNSVEQAINELPPRCQEIFIMSKQENMRYKDIATELNISIKTVEHQMSKALSILRKKMKDKIFTVLIVLFNRLKLLKPKKQH